MKILCRMVICTVLIQHVKIEVGETANVQPVKKAAPVHLHTRIVRKNNRIESSFCDDEGLKEKAISHPASCEVSHG